MNRPSQATSLLYASTLICVLMIFGGVYTGLGIIGLVVVILIYLVASGSLGRDKMHNTENIRAGSDVVKVTPKFYQVGDVHFEAKVEFEDGSWYRTKIAGHERQYRSYGGWGPRKIESSYDEWGLRQAITTAIAEHDRVATEMAVKQ